MASQKPAVELDPILAQLGAFGKYNIVNYALLLFPVYLAGIYGTVYVFEAPDINYRCHISECSHIENTSIWLPNAIPAVNNELSKCTRYPLKEGLASDNMTCISKEEFDTTKEENCESYDYLEHYSIVSDFNLGCRNWKRTLVGTLHNAGLFISLPLTGILSDRFGRKTALAVASLFNGIFGLLRSFSVNYDMFIAFEFLETAIGAGAYSTAFVLAIELVGPKGRVFGNTIVNVVYVFGLMTLSALAWKLQDWRNLLRIVYTPALLVFSYLWILNESVRWLISKGKADEAVRILKSAAKMNKVEISEELLAPLAAEKVPLENKEEKEVEKKPASTLSQAIKSRIILKRLVVCSFLWITCTFVYYGLSINSVSLAGNMYVNFMLVGFVEIPANFVCLLVLDKFGRKRTLIITYVLSACLCLSLSFLPKDQKWWSLVVYLSGKFMITVSYSTVYIYVSEVFPTSARQSLLAVCSTIGRVGSTLAPLTPLLALYYDNLPAIFFGSLALVASVLVFTLPETINMPLPDTIEEAEELSKRKVRAEEA